MLFFSLCMHVVMYLCLCLILSGNGQLTGLKFIRLIFYSFFRNLCPIYVLLIFAVNFIWADLALIRVLIWVRVDRLLFFVRFRVVPRLSVSLILTVYSVRIVPCVTVSPIPVLRNVHHGCFMFVHSGHFRASHCIPLHNGITPWVRTVVVMPWSLSSLAMFL